MSVLTCAAGSTVACSHTAAHITVLLQLQVQSHAMHDGLPYQLGGHVCLVAAGLGSTMPDGIAACVSDPEVEYRLDFRFGLT